MSLDRGSIVIINRKLKRNVLFCVFQGYIYQTARAHNSTWPGKTQNHSSGRLLAPASMDNPKFFGALSYIRLNCLCPESYRLVLGCSYLEVERQSIVTQCSKSRQWCLNRFSNGRGCPTCLYLSYGPWALGVCSLRFELIFLHLPVVSHDPSFAPVRVKKPVNKTHK